MKKEHLNILITAQVAVGIATLSTTLISCVKEPVHISKPITIEKTTEIKIIQNNKIDSVISYASEKVLDPYTWGGSYKHDKFDCSSLVQGAYAHVGIELPRTAYSQYKALSDTVNKDNIKKGDLVFYLTDKTRHIPVTHVALYIGNGKIIEAKGEKKGIIISKFNDKNLVGIKRVKGV